MHEWKKGYWKIILLDLTGHGSIMEVTKYVRWALHKLPFKYLHDKYNTTILLFEI